MDDEATRLRRELDGLVHAISHDLRAPLRSLAGFTEALREDFAGKLDADGERYLQRIGEATDTLTRCVDGLLELAQVGRAELQVEEVDLVPRVREMVDRLQAQAPRRNVVVDTPASLVVHADAALVKHALAHLIDNAWKFTATRPVAEIHLSAQPRDGETEVTLSDNGVGFESRLARKLFVPFARVHGDEYSGTGVGLAVVRRIIERHGGRIAIESRAGQGTTVRFTLG